MATYKLLKADQVVYDLGNAFGQIKAKNLFTTEYDCYKVFVSLTGNQTTYKRIRLLDASDNIITGSGYSYNSNFLRHTGYTFTDATAGSHGALIIDAYTTLRDQAYTGKVAMTIWHPNDATNKTAIFTSHMSFSASNQVQQTLTCTGENTTAATGLSFEAYGIGEDIENVSYECYGVEL